jgi:acyl-CoA reductase-like NAD-dependent aldehyde dehydrogenase
MDSFVIADNDAVNAALSSARAAAEGWRATMVPDRLRIIRRARHLLAARAGGLAETMRERRPPAETLTAEILPLLAAARFLERRAAGILAPVPQRTGRPLWLFGVTAEIRREACGVVLILGPANFPLFLPGVQILQALAAGNAVCAKPAPGGAAPLRAWAQILAEAGLPDGLLHVLDESHATGIAAARAGFDRIALTGSAGTGRLVLAAAAETLTPCTMELSGNDAVLVLPGADLEATAAALAYGLRLNGGATCIAPRRVFVQAAQAAALEHALLSRVGAIPPAWVGETVAAHLAARVDEAVAQGARLLSPQSRSAGGLVPPTILADANPAMNLLQEDVFAPWLALVPVRDVEHALASLAACPYALGASIFGPVAAARAVAARIGAGSVCINDLIVPTADPRLPFGGRGRSGFGVTRGAAGLLEMTVVKTVSIRRGRFRPHLAPPRAGDPERYAAMIGLLYGDVRAIFSVLRRMRRGAQRKL